MPFDTLELFASREPWASLLFPYMAGILVKGALICVGGWIATRLSQQRPAAVRHLLLGATTATLVLLPVVAPAVPSWSLSLPIHLPPVVALAPVAHTSGVGASDGGTVAGPANAGPAGPSSLASTSAVSAPVRPIRPTAGSVDGDHSVPWPVLVALAWCVGAAVLVLRLMWQLGAVHRLTRRARPVRSPGALRVLDRACRRIGMTRRPALLESEAAEVPMLCGLTRASIVVPRGAAEWSDSRLESVLLHELAHARRRDVATQLLAQVACAIHWPSPLVWRLAAIQRAQSEHACDDEVIRHGVAPTRYASNLVAIARSLKRGATTPSLAPTAVRPGGLADRIVHLLDERRNRRRLSRVEVLRMGTLAAAVLMPLAGFGFVIGPALAAPTGFQAEDVLETGERASAGTVIRLSEATPAATAAPVIPAAPVPASEEPPSASGRTSDCWWGGGRGLNVRVAERHGVRGASWSADSCHGRIEVSGSVRFGRDLGDVAGISDGGLLHLEETVDGVVRRIEARPSGGAVELEWFVDGNSLPVGAEARAWLEELLPLAARRTGVLAEDQVRWLLAHGGRDAVLSEVRSIPTDSVRRRFLSVAALGTDLTESGMIDLLELAGDEIGSDHELAVLLAPIAERFTLDGAVAAAWRSALATMTSDAEQRRVLEVLVRKESPSDAELELAIEASAEIGSDAELAGLLSEIVRDHELSGDLRRKLREAAGGIASDAEAARVEAAFEGEH